VVLLSVQKLNSENMPKPKESPKETTCQETMHSLSRLLIDLARWRGATLAVC